jgi:nicotinamide mononucleotide transporter
VESPAEIIAFGSGLLSVWLAQRLHPANWVAGFLSVGCLAFVFHDAKLYATALLQLAFAGLCIYGWYCWTRRGREGGVRVSRAPRAEFTAGVVLAGLATVACASLLDARTDSPVPWPDAAVLGFSLLATWLQARGRIECWWTWIGVDLVSIPLYFSRGLPLTALLYVLFLALCLGGVRSWRRRMLGR